jgi:putative oxidoreductase
VILTINSQWRTRLLNSGLLALRLGIGFGLFWLHGRAKLVSASAYLLSARKWDFVNVVASLGFPAPFAFAAAAALAESVGALLLAVGLLTRPAGAAVAFTMTVAISLHLRGSQTPELALLYLLPAVSLALTGPGRYSLDSLWTAFRVREVDARKIAVAE